ncbi:MAG: globin [Acidimicrobiia bacterium]|nr:globin [Acidimicrobiia bacterium]
MQIGSSRPPQSVYEVVGGRDYFERLIGHFYQGIESDPVLRPMYPADLTEARRNMVEFLGQYWGGPTDYSDRKGHPRLRMRHARFPVDEGAKAAWLGHMEAALAETEGADEDVRQAMVEYFRMAANHLLNR